MSENFYSQHGEDRFIVENMPLPAMGGVIVDVGAGHWRDESNSLHFEQAGWKVILVEANPDRSPGLMEHRKAKCFICACGSFNGMTDFIQTSDPNLSGIRRTQGKRITVPMRRLDGILAESGISHVDILSIDTEGTELDVWAGLDPSIRPTLVIVEWATSGIEADPISLIRKFLNDGYALIYAAGGSFIFQFRQRMPCRGS